MNSIPPLSFWANCSTHPLVSLWTKSPPPVPLANRVASLEMASMEEAHLEGADLRYADLRKVVIEIQQLKEVFSLQGAILDTKMLSEIQTAFPEKLKPIYG